MARRDFKIISQWVKQDSKILDLGCGDGALLKLLSKERNGSGYGVDTSIDKIMKSLDNNITEVLGLVEKHTVEKAPSNMAVVGRYIIEPEIFGVLEKQNKGTGNEIQLTDAIANRIGKSNCFGYKFSEERFDCGSKLGFIQANIKLSIERKEMNQKLKNWLRNEILDDNK